MIIVKLLLTSAAVRREREAQWRSLRINLLAQSSAVIEAREAVLTHARPGIKGVYDLMTMSMKSGKR
jgi:hypothetical protein